MSLTHVKPFERNNSIYENQINFNSILLFFAINTSYHYNDAGIPVHNIG